MNKPFIMKPSGLEYLWGGSRLNDEFDKQIPLSPLAETWECSTHPEGPSFAATGEFTGLSLTEILENRPDFMGKRHKGKTGLPVLIKFIDADKDLSVQVHPTDAFAAEHENGQLGKTEMWYVLDASKDAKLIYGFNRDVCEETVTTALSKGNFTDYLQEIPVNKDDVFFIDAGTVHAVGAGCLIAEVQESSNITYRLYDYDRVNKNGLPRELHIDKALAVANMKKSVAPRQPLRVLKYTSGTASELLCRCKYFEVYRLIINTERRQIVTYRADDLSFRVLLCVNGCGTISFENESVLFYKGDCVFVPADSVEMIIHGQAQFLDVRG